MRFPRPGFQFLNEPFPVREFQEWYPRENERKGRDIAKMHITLKQQIMKTRSKVFEKQVLKVGL